MTYSYLMKFIIVGDAGVGKSCMLSQYINKEFIGSYELTIGVEFAAKIVRVLDEREELHTVKIQIWDTAGQETFRAITQSYYKGAAGVILVYDITNEKSFTNMKKWYDDIKSKCPDDVDIIIVGNKKDLDANREVDINEVKKFIQKQEIKYPYCETTAKEYDSIDRVFNGLVENLINKIYQEKLPEGIKCISGTRSVDLNKKSEKNKQNKCCIIL